MKRYRIEFKSKDLRNSFRLDCVESELEYAKKTCKEISKEYDESVCYYREFPLTKSKKIYF